MSKKLPRCAHCYRPFRPDRYNAYRQECCTRPACVLERKRRRQRKWYAARRADPVFREEENTRCAKANRRRRAAIRARAGPSEPDHDPAELRDVLTGVLSQLTDSDDPVQLRASVRDYAARSRRMALWASTGTDPP